MQRACVAALLCAALLPAQDWRRTLNDVTSRPASEFTYADVERFEAAALLAGAYFQSLRPGDVEANRDFVRRLTTYMVTVEALQRDPRMRAGVGRAYLALARFRWLAPAMGNQAGPAGVPGEPPPPPPPPDEPTFTLQAPEIGKVRADQQAEADDLTTRYELAAGKAAVAWKGAATLRRTLQADGMTLNAQTEASVARLQIYFDLAADALKARDWAEARTNIERGEYEAEKVSKVTGR